MATNIADKTKQTPEETLMMRSNWDQRRKNELSSLVDLTSSVQEKYGVRQSFLLKLRSQNDKNDVIKYKNPVSSRWSDPNFGAIIIDDRAKKVELIREVPDLKEAYSPRMRPNETYMSTSRRDLKHSNSTSETRLSYGEQRQKTLANFLRESRSGKNTTTSKFTGRETLQCSRTTSNLFRQTYSIEQDPAIKKRLKNMGDLQSREQYMKQLHQHLATASTNEDLAQLQVVGTNVYQSEKGAAEHLIQQARQDEQSGRPSMVRLLWNKTQEE